MVVFVDEGAARHESSGTECVVDVNGCHVVYRVDDIDAWRYKVVCMNESFKFCSERALFA
jgi:hypothetical protein